MRLPVLAVLATLLVAGCTAPPEAPGTAAPSVEVPPSVLAGEGPVSPGGGTETAPPPSAWARALEGRDVLGAASSPRGDRVLVLLVAPAGGEELAALDAATGATLWQAPVPGGRGVAALGERVFVARMDPSGAGAEARDLRTGEVVWRQEGSGGGTRFEGLALDGRRLYVAADSIGVQERLVAYDLAEGRVAWRAEAPPAAGEGWPTDEVALLEGAGLVVRLSKGILDGRYSYRVVAHRADTGEVAWTHDPPQAFASPVRLAATGQDAHVLRPDGDGGVEVVRLAADGAPRVTRVRSPGEDRVLEIRGVLADGDGATFHASVWTEVPGQHLAPALLSWDGRTGEPRWEVGPGRNLQRAGVLLAGGHVLHVGLERFSEPTGRFLQRPVAVLQDPATGHAVGSWTAPQACDVPVVPLVAAARVVVLCRAPPSGLAAFGFDVASAVGVPAPEPPKPPVDPLGQWRGGLRIDGSYGAAMTPAGDVLFVAHRDPARPTAQLVALAGDSGTTRWTKPLPETYRWSVATDGKLVVVGGSTPVEGGSLAWIEARDASTGALAWNVTEPVPSGFLHRLALGGGRVFVDLTSGGEILAAFDAATGKKLWRRDVATSWRMQQDDVLAPTPDGALLVRVTSQGEKDPAPFRVLALRAQDGEIAWERTVERPYGPTPRLALGKDGVLLAWPVSGANPGVRIERLSLEDGTLQSSSDHAVPDAQSVEVHDALLDDANRTLHVALALRGPDGATRSALLSVDTRGGLPRLVRAEPRLDLATLGRIGSLVLLSGVEPWGNSHMSGTRAGLVVLHAAHGEVVGGWAPGPCQHLMRTLLVGGGRAALLCRATYEDLSIYGVLPERLPGEAYPPQPMVM